MSKKPGIFKRIRNVNNAINEIGETHVENQKRGAEAKPEKRTLQLKTFKHQYPGEMVVWINSNKIDVQNICHNGNKYVVFFWQNKIV